MYNSNIFNSNIISRPFSIYLYRLVGSKLSIVYNKRKLKAIDLSPFE